MEKGGKEKRLIGKNKIEKGGKEKRLYGELRRETGSKGSKNICFFGIQVLGFPYS